MTEYNCSLCNKKYKRLNNYIKHFESKHNKCNCVGGGTKDKNMAKVFEKAKKSIDKTMKQIENNTIEFGLDINLNKKEIEKIPVELREKIKSLILENQYLKGTINTQDKQIKLMKRQIDTCIKSVGLHYSVISK